MRRCVYGSQRGHLHAVRRRKHPYVDAAFGSTPSTVGFDMGPHMSRVVPDPGQQARFDGVKPV